MNNLNSVGSRVGRLYNHNFNYDNILTGQIGKLIPIQCDEVNPRERWQQNVSFLMRFAPMLAPAMVKMNVCFFSFFVPTRILTPRNSQHSTWEKFILSMTGKKEDIPDLPSYYTSSPLENDTYTDAVKNKLVQRFATGTLADYLDYPVNTEEGIRNDTLFHVPYDSRIRLDGFLAYQMIYNYWFRRDQIEPEITFPLSLGNVDLSNEANSDYVHNEEWDVTSDSDFFEFLDNLFKLRDKNYERDYFTSSLPEPQYGEDVNLIDSQAFNITWSNPLDLTQRWRPVHDNGGFPLYIHAHDNMNQGLLWMDTVSMNDYTRISKKGSSVSGSGYYESTGLDSNSIKFSFGKEGSLGANPPFVDISSLPQDLVFNGPALSINDFRAKMQLQAVREAINRGGTMYVEVMQNIYDSLVPDARLQQPVYLGGIKCPVQIGTVVQTSETTATTPLGTLAGKAQSASGGRLFRSKKAFAEHGYVMTIMCVAPRTGYIGGLPRKWMKHDPFDYFNKYFAHLGEDTIKKQELYCDPWDGSGKWNESFGYQERYNDYRHAISRAHGEMRHSKDYWHLYRKFDEAPSLSTDFIKMEQSDFSRLFEYETIQGTSNEMFDCMIAFDIKKKSPVPKFGTPYNFI